MATAPLDDEFTPTALGHLAVSHSEDVAAGIDFVMAWLNDHPDCRDAWREQIERAFARDIVSAAMTSKRGRIDRQEAKAGAVIGTIEPKATKRAAPAPVVSMGDVIRLNSERYLDTPIWGGKRLRDATIAEVRDCARNYHITGTTMITNSRRYAAIAAAAARTGADDTATIGSTLDEQTVRHIWEKTDGQ